jgi:anthranilate/para-aminobenzoate synthase component II
MPTKPDVTRKCLVNGCENRIEVLGDEAPVCDVCLSWFAIWEALAAEVKKKEETGVYGNWCHDPKLCAGKSYCPRDPTCAD